jgi:gas vesicle protein
MPTKTPQEEITENFMEKILDVIIQNVQDALKKFQDTKNKEYEKTQRQINELGGALNRHQSETENTINREINELKLKIKNIKEEVTQDMDNLRKKESNRNTKHSGRPLQQTRTSGRQNLRTRR